MADVIIIGGGPAGSGLGCYLSNAGISNLIIEKANHPREHVGESLVTNTTRIFDEIGFLPTMEAEGFVRKYGAVWHAPKHRGQLGIRFAEFPIEGVTQPYSYHVERSQFDLKLLKHAEKSGSEVLQGARVTKVLFDDDQASGVRVRLGGQEVDLPCKIVVDASGRDTFLGRHLKLKSKDPLFDQYAIHAWYENVDKGDDATANDIHIFFLPIERGWVWQIPITEEITSIGLVVEKKDVKRATTSIEDFYQEMIKTNSDLTYAMRNAKRVNEYTTEADYSYAMDKVIGNGYLIVGDAARFVDPIFSSGISIALHSAKFASENIIEALKVNDFREELFLSYQEKLNQGVEIWYEFIRLYYKLFSTFTYFIQVPKYRLQVFRLLQGEVFDRTEVPVLKAMRDFIEMVENSENEQFKHFKDQLTDIPLELESEVISLIAAD